MTRLLAVAYALAVAATLLAFVYGADPHFVRELVDFVLWLVSGVSG